MIKYTNGNYNISLLSDGTKIREYEEFTNPTYPESIDLLITKFCDLNCNFCHEMSTIEGKHGDLEKALNLLKDLPSGTEIAIGGGNPLSHPDLLFFLSELQRLKLVANITINHLHLKKYKALITFLIKEDLIKGLGISYNSKNLEEIRYFSNLTDNLVIHLIAGIHTTDILDSLYSLFSSNNKTLKILLLGYKQFGFGINYYQKTHSVEDKVYLWYTTLHQYFKYKNLIISFDNLGIKQLNIKRFFTEKKWKEFYMGDDGQFTMYIDTVNQTYTISSTNNKRVSFEGKNIIEIFSHVKNGLK